MSAHTASKLASQLRTTEGASVSDFVMEPEANGGEAGRAKTDDLYRVAARPSEYRLESIKLYGYRAGGQYPIDFRRGQ